MYWKYAAKRIFYGILMYIILIFIFSVLFNATNEATTKAQIEEALRAETTKMRNMDVQEVQKYIAERRAYKYHLYHLDQPIFQRIVWRTIDTITLNFGNSTNIKSAKGERDVWTIVSETIPRTILLFTTAMILELILGVWLGLKKAQRAGGVLDKSTSIATMVVYGMPRWWLGMIMIMFFAYQVNIFPSGGLHTVPPPQGFAYFLDILYHMALPMLTLLIIDFWGTAYLTRNIVLGTLQEDFVMSARARGIPENKVLFGHTMRTSAPPIVTMALLSLLSSVSGNILFEGIFSWPGMGNLYWIAIEQNDVPVLMGLLAITTALYIAGLVILDLIYGFLDPRIKVGGKA